MSDIADERLYRSIRGAAIWSGLVAMSVSSYIFAHELAAIQGWPGGTLTAFEVLFGPVILLLWVWGGMAVVGRAADFWQSERLTWGAGQ